MDKRTIVKIAGFVLCALFFTAPLVQCSQDSSMTATGLEIATGMGDLMGPLEKSYPAVFLLLLMPFALVLTAFTNEDGTFPLLRNISIGGFVVHIIFIIVTYAEINSGKGEAAMFNGAYKLTIFNWLMPGIYIGLFCFTRYCIAQAKNKVSCTSCGSENTNDTDI